MKQHCKYLFLTALLLLCSTIGYTSDLKTVHLQLKWKHQFQFAGYYAAIEKGFYKDVGLNVITIEAQANETPFEAVNSGKAQFGTCTTDILVARSNGMQPVVLANIYQHSPHIVVAMQSSGIRVVHDLAGKKIAAEPGAADLYAFLLSEGIKLDRFNVEELDFSIDKFINGKVDAITAYSTDELFPLEQAGYKLNILWPSSSGIDFYGDLLFTTEDLIKKDPLLVEKFREASLKGWAYALNNKEEIVNLIYNKYSKRHSLDHLRFEAEETDKLIAGDVVEIGYTNPGRWESIIKSYVKLGIVNNSLSVQGLLYADYKKNPFVIPWKLMLVLSLSLVFALALVLFFYHISRNLKKEIKKREIAETELKSSNDNLEKRVIERTKLLTDALSEIDDFAYSMSHDLRTPLRGIDGYSSLLLEDYGNVLDETAMQHLKSIRKEAQHLGDVLDALHGLSNVSRKELLLEQTNLSELADQLMQQLAYSYADRAIEIIIQPELTEYCDRKLMKTALQNLFSNALKFSNREGIAKVEFGMTTENGVRTYFVKDNGVGFNMDYVNKLFHNFQRLHRYNDFEGIGIGLATVRRVIVKHGGTIRADSKLGKGSTFTFTLNIAERR
ncbi:MAG: ABC transporter substrate-binding protein [Candidatus Cloacimonas sp.]|jgi:signal transduction histidine kinase|nr:ABC transporter substrate-binding protein [Candidatus Cloacimonas sp.]